MKDGVKKARGRPRKVKNHVDRSLRLSKADWARLESVAKRLGTDEGASWADRVRAVLREVEA